MKFFERDCKKIGHRHAGERQTIGKLTKNSNELDIRNAISIKISSDKRIFLSNLIADSNIWPCLEMILEKFR